MGLFGRKKQAANGPTEAEIQAAASSELAEESEFLEKHSDRPPNALRVVVIRARDLPVMDRKVLGVGGSSDPLCTIHVEGATAKTKTILKNLNPVWLERFELAADDAESTVTFTVDDYDALSANDLIGHARVALKTLADEKPHRAWRALCDAEGRSRVGGPQLELCLRWVHDARLAPELPREIVAVEQDELLALEPNELHVLLVRARDLPVMDRNLLSKGGSSDPVVTLTLDNAKYKSRVIKKCLNPVWMQPFAMAAEDETATLHVLVEDWDELSSADFIGQCHVRLKELANRKLKRQTYALLDATGSRARVGRVELAFRWRHAPSRVLALPEQCLRPEQHSTEPCNELQLVLVRARALRIMDRNLLSKGGSSDPFVTVDCDGERVKSSVKMKELNPVWLEVLALHVEEQTADITVTVDDYDMLSGNDFMGTFEVSMASLKSRKLKRKWFALGNKPGAAKPVGSWGKVDLAMRWIHNPDRVLQLPAVMHAPDAFPDKPPNALLLTVIRARALQIMDRNLLGGGGSSDPFVALELDGETRKTGVKYKCLKPVWLEQMSVPVEDRAAWLELKVWDYDMTSGNDLMGTLSLPMEHLAGRDLRRRWCTLEGDSKLESYGSLELALRWVHDPALELRLPEAMLAVESEADEAESPNELRLCLVRAKALPAMDRNLFSKGGSSDPFLTFELEGEVRTSTVKSKQLNPIYLEQFEFPMEETQVPLRLLVEDYDLLSGNDFMGRAVVDLTGLVEARTLVRHWVALEARMPAKGKMASRVKEKLGRVELALRWIHNPDRVIALPERMLEPELQPDEPPNALLIAIIRGRDLPVKDKHLFSKGGSSDPFVTFHVGNESVKSSVKYKTLNPTWEELYVVPVDKVELELVATVADYDFVSGADFMGEFALPIVALRDRKPLRNWFRLVARNGSAVSGKLDVAVRWVHNPDFALTIPEDMFSHGDDEEMPPNELLICLVRARDLPVMDRSMLSRSAGSSDPYVTLALGSVTNRSGVRYKSLFPVWMERFDFALAGEESELVLEACVWDKDLVSRDDRMGHVSVPLNGVARRAARAWYPLLREAKTDADGSRGSGELELMLRLVYNPALRTAFYDMGNCDDLERIAQLCLKAVTDHDDAPLKLLIARCATCDHVFLDDARRVTPARVVAGRVGAKRTLKLLALLSVDLRLCDAQGRAPAHYAAKHDRADALRQLAILDADLEVRDGYGKQPAHYAAEEGADCALRTLAALGCDLSEETDTGKTPACLAAQRGKVQTLELLHELKVDVGARGHSFGGRSPLHFAAQHGQLGAIRALARLGVDVNATDCHGQSAAHAAALNAQPAALVLLKELGVDQTIQDHDRETADHYAALER